MDALMMCVFANNMWWFPVLVNRGDMDYYLVKPVSPLFFLSLKEFAANSSVNLLGSLGIFVWSLTQYEGNIYIWKLILFILFIINGTVLYYLLNMLFIVIVFWTQSPRGLGDLFWSLSHALERPDRVYTGVLRIIFTTVLPFSLAASYPARIFLEDFDINIILHIILVSILLWGVFLMIWKRGLKIYGSASS